MSDFLNICFRTILILIILFFITKMMGKKQISELNFFDYVVGITIGSIAADISLALMLLILRSSAFAQGSQKLLGANSSPKTQAFGFDFTPCTPGILYSSRGTRFAKGANRHQRREQP